MATERVITTTPQQAMLKLKERELVAKEKKEKESTLETGGVRDQNKYPEKIPWDSPLGIAIKAIINYNR